MAGNRVYKGVVDDTVECDGVVNGSAIAKRPAAFSPRQLRIYILGQTFISGSLTDWNPKLRSARTQTKRKIIIAIDDMK